MAETSAVTAERSQKSQKSQVGQLLQMFVCLWLGAAVMFGFIQIPQSWDERTAADFCTERGMVVYSMIHPPKNAQITTQVSCAPPGEWAKAQTYDLPSSGLRVAIGTASIAIGLVLCALTFGLSMWLWGRVRRFRLHRSTS